MRRYVVRNYRSEDRNGILGQMGLAALLLGGVAFVAVRNPFDVPDSSAWILLLLVVVVAALTVLPTLLIAVLMVVAGVKELLFGSTVLVIGREGLRMPEVVPWSETTLVRVGPVATTQDGHREQAGTAESTALPLAVTVGIGARSPSQMHAYAVAAAAVRELLQGSSLRHDTPVGDLLAELEAHDRWQEDWSAVPHPVGHHMVAPPGISFDLDAIRAAVHRYAPHVPVEPMPRLPVEASYTPHGSVAQLLDTVRGYRRTDDGSG